MSPSARLTAAVLSLGLGSFTYVTAESLPIGLLPSMAAGLHVSESEVGLLVGAYGLVVVLTSIPLTVVTRHVRRRTLLTRLLVLFVAATAVAALAPGYEIMLVARVVTGLSQALFWSIVVPAAAELAPAERRGRAVALVFGGASLAAVLGVPIGTAIGEVAGWRMAFVALAGLGVAAWIAAVALLPVKPPAQTTAQPRSRPWGPYIILVIVTALVTTGTFAAMTYVVPFLVDVAGFPLSAVGPLLLLRGVAGLVGVAIGGSLADRSAARAIEIAIAAQVVALFAMGALPASPLAAAAFLALSGLAFSALTAGLGTRVIEVAPGSVDVASAGTSTAVNIGITTGAFLGGLLLPLAGVRTILLVAGVMSLAGLVVALADRERPERGRVLRLHRRQSRRAA
jgi:DHA1 family inner membrane transport protein